MSVSDKFWREVSPSRFPHERVALAYLRERLPDHEPWRVWTNFEFQADDGSINEVDALVHSPAGFFLVEIKGHQGRVSGDQGTLTFSQDGRRKSIDHPRRLTSLKAKRLISLLSRTKVVLRSQLRLPRLEELVFLSHASENALEMPPAGHVTFTEEVDPSAGVISALTERGAPGLRPEPTVRGDKPLAKLIASALDEIGIVRRRSRLRIGDYELSGRLDEGVAYADFIGENTNNPGLKFRVRRYSAAPSNQLERDQVFNATRREHSLLSRLTHPGILAVRGYAVDEYGPAIVFEHNPDAQRLDRYLAEHGDGLDVEARLDLVRKVAEPLRFAHERGIVHRCLSPQSILVEPSSEGSVAQVKLMNWSTGSLASNSSTQANTLLGGTLHPEDFHDELSSVFLAPELRRNPEGIATTLDVFSLGAVAYQVFAAEPPAAGPDALYDKIRDHGLDLRATVDATPAALSRLIEKATRAQVSDRFDSVADFLLALDLAAEELARPVNEVTDPRVAGPGDTLPDGTRIVNRLGSGATAIAFLVERGDGADAEQFVFKVAREIDRNSHIEAEARALESLDSPRVTRLVETLKVGGFVGFLSKPASKETLRTRLRRDGAFQPELLQRFGDQLLEALSYLELRGINHRDLKPDNIAISDGDKKAPLGLVLFDFSLSGQPLDLIDVGTPQYADPFLADRVPKRWDLAAERYSAAVTLYEMATAVLPRWGDGASDPRLTRDELELDGDLLPAGFRQGLLSFFQKGLARDPGQRFDNADGMRAAWALAFQEVDRPSSTTRSSTVEGDATPSSLESLTATLGRKTALLDLPFSARARTAFDRLDLFTVEALLAIPPNKILRQRGVGEKTRREMQDAMRALRALFPEVEIGGELPAESGPTRTSSAQPPAGVAKPIPVERIQDSVGGSEGEVIEPLVRDLDRLLARVRKGSGRQPGRRKKIIDAVLGLGGASPTALSFPNQSRAAELLGLNPGTVSIELSRLREIWSKDLSYQALRNDLAQVLERNFGVMTPSEAAEALLVERGSKLVRSEALQVAAAVARVATEAEASTSDGAPRWQLRRRDGSTWLAHSEDHVHYAARVVEKGGSLATQDPLPGRDAVEAALLSVPRPEQIPALPAARLARLSAAAISTIGLSARGELYPVPLEPARAIRLSLGTLVGAGVRHPLARQQPGLEGVRLIGVEEVHECVSSRYPGVGPLPARPELDELLQEAGWSGRWSGQDDAYRLRVDDAHSVSAVSRSSYRTMQAAPGATVSAEVAEARRFEDRLRATVEQRRFLVAKVPMHGLERSLGLVQALDSAIEVVDLDARLIEAIDAHLAEKKVNPARFYEADAKGPADSVGWGRVQRIVTDAIGRVTESLTSATDPICVHNVGLLARYDLWEPLEILNGLAGGSGGRACVVLFPGSTDSPSFALFGKSIPALPSQFVSVPKAWLQSLHLSAAS